MKLFLDNKEIDATKLKEMLDALNPGNPDGGSFEMIALYEIDIEGNMYFDIEKYSTFGG